MRRAAGDLVVRAYRAPVLDVLGWKWHLEPADAEDLTQEFFARALEQRWFDRFDPARSRFRSFLRLLAERFAANAHAANQRQKRGGGARAIAIDELQDIIPDADTDAERRFRDAWIRSVFDLALAALRDEGASRDRTVHVQLFERYDLADDARPTYAELGATFGLGDSQVINHLAWARRRFRTHVLHTLRQLAGSDAEYRDDVRDLLGIDPP